MVRAVVTRARGLRQEATDAERRLWAILRDRRLGGAEFRRQHPVGPFIVDFACLAERLIAEADGGQHCGSDDDARRAGWLERHGWRVVRFWNNDILQNPDGVFESIRVALLPVGDGGGFG